MLLRNVPRSVRIQTREKVFVFTDASFHGWGVVAFLDGHVTILGSKWKTARININELEACAVQHALDILGNNLRGTHVIFLVDNTSVVYAMRKGRSNNFVMNAVMERLAKYSELLDFSFETQWVESQHNLADAPSRGTQLGVGYYGLVPTDLGSLGEAR